MYIKMNTLNSISLEFYEQNFREIDQYCKLEISINNSIETFETDLFYCTYFFEVYYLS